MNAVDWSEIREQKTGSESLSDDIKIERFDISYESKILFKDATLSLTYGKRYGLVAPNGLGKSTLLSHIANRTDQFKNIPQHFLILYVQQEVEGSDVSALQSVINADTERTKLLEVEQKLLKDDTDKDAGEKLSFIHRRLVDIEAYSAEARASSILSGLQFTDEMKNRPTRDFSGGWRMRISLARSLFLRPTLLLLDEPTNHLDIVAVIWLETFLKKYKSTLLVVSHDQEFLNNVCTDIIHIRRENLDYYPGNYNAFKSQFKKKTLAELKLYNKQQEMIKIAKRSGKKLSINDPIAKPKDYTVRFEFPDPGKLSSPIIQVDDASFGYHPDKILFKNLNFSIDMKSRVALIGPNGVGKSTLLKLILGELEPTRGNIHRNRKLVTGYFSQHFVDKLDYDLHPVGYLREKFPDLSVAQLRQCLGRFGLSGKTHLQPIRSLSGGQKSRVVLTEISMVFPHILFLDEPTNHLDIESIDALSDALKDYKGGIVLISHDARLINQVCDTICIVDGVGNVYEYDGDFEDYRADIVYEFEQ